MALTIADRRLGAILLEQGFLSDAPLQRGLAHQIAEGGRLAEVLISLGLISELEILRAIEAALGIPVVDLTEMTPDAAALGKVDSRLAQLHHAVPLAEKEDGLHIALADVLETKTYEDIENATGLTLVPLQALRSHINWALAQHYPTLGLTAQRPATLPEVQKQRSQMPVEQDGIGARHPQEEPDKQPYAGMPIGQILVSNGVLSEERLYEALAQQAQMTFLPNPPEFHPEQVTLQRLQQATAIRLSAVPVEETATEITVLISDPRQRAEIVEKLPKRVKFVLVLPAKLHQYLEQFYVQPKLRARLQQAQTELRRALREARGQYPKPNKTKIELDFESAQIIANALPPQKPSPSRLEEDLRQLGKLSPEQLAQRLAEQLGYDFVDEAATQLFPHIVELLPERLARRYGAVPLRLEGNTLVVAMKDPRNVYAIDDIQLITSYTILPVVMTEGAIKQLIAQYWG